MIPKPKPINKAENDLGPWGSQSSRHPTPPCHEERAQDMGMRNGLSLGYSEERRISTAGVRPGG